MLCDLVVVTEVNCNYKLSNSIIMTRVHSKWLRFGTLPASYAMCHSARPVCTFDEKTVHSACPSHYNHLGMINQIFGVHYKKTSSCQ